MSGQGSPKFVVPFCAAKILAVFAVVAAHSLLSLLASPTARSQELYPLKPMSVASNALRNVSGNLSGVSAVRNSASARRLRLRLSWGGGTAQTWTGGITVIHGAFSNVAPLGLDADANAAVMQVGEELVIRHWSPTNYGGADVTLDGTRNTQIRIVMKSTEQPEVEFERTISFDQMVGETTVDEIDALGNRCSVARVPGDEINVSFQRPHLIFKPGELFKFSVSPNFTPFAGRTVNCRIKLVPANRTGISISRSLFSETLSFRMDDDGSAEPQEVSFPVPINEAIYNVEIELEGSRYQASFASKKSTVRRNIQLLVLGLHPKKSEWHSWRQVSSVEAVNVSQGSFPSWSQFSKIAGLPVNDTLGNELRTPVKIGQQNLMQLSPGGWQAIPLSVDRLGKPHIVELEYVADGEIAIGVSLLQPDSGGQIPTYGFDSGVYVPPSIVSDEGDGTRVRRHRLTVWPETKTPYLLVANRHGTANATIGTVKVFAGPDRIDSSETNINPAPNRRKLMAFYETPLFPENFGAREKVDPDVAEPLDDWRMFYEGADRFIEYLKANSYRGAFITVACDGSSIYPSDLLSPSPKHDNGTFFGSAQDPIRKDILEMLFRMFEREGLVLVPSLALSGPLPEVEALRKRDGTDSEFDLVDMNGIYRESGMSDRLPAYNPLNLTVQRAVRRVVEEVAERYKSYQSFEGIAIVCRPDTFTLLPGRQWGYDSLTVQQFVQSQADLSEMPSQWSELQGILLGSHRKQWTQWRAKQMTQWYQDLAAGVQQALPNGRLYLAPIDLYRNDETASALSPSLHSSTNFEQIMLHLGFESDLVKANLQSESSLSRNLVFLNPHRIAPDQSLSSQRVELAVENSKQAHDFFAKNDYAGDLFTHRVSWAHFAQLQAKSPFGEQQSALMRLQQMAPAEAFNRKRFAQSIKDRDARLLVDGGWMMTMGQEESILEMMKTYNQLPDERFNEVHSSAHPDLSSRPLAVRQLEFENETYFYAANASPWPLRVTLLLHSNSAATPTVESFSNERLVARPASRETGGAQLVSVSRNSQGRFSNADGNGHPFELTLDLPAYGLAGGRMGKMTEVADFGFAVPPEAVKDLRRHVYALQAKLTKAGNPNAVAVLENSDFEFNGQPTLSGWDTGQQSTGSVRLDLNQEATESTRQMGRASLRMSNEGQSPVWVRSNVFEATETGRISISVWLKTDEPTLQPPLRLALEGQSNGASYYRFGSVGSLSPDPNANQIEARWKRFAVHFDDLPVEGISNVRVGFDLMGPGQVNIDNVQVFDRWFDENDAKAITQMLASTGPLLSDPATFDSCRRLLESYWLRFLDQHIEIERSANHARVNEPRVQASTANQISNSDSSVWKPKPALENENDDLNRDDERKVPMFRRFRSLVPQRKPTVR